ncbi:MAG: hypothetical protein DRJ42_24710 [Deltaproteobacteria bacterium]|nr:MAG: hypothetical protein DRJ42_24710 [Deltaproteobacteria bacterium]
MTFGDSTLPAPLCAPVGERCCVDEDGDLHGAGVGCLGTDCDETDTDINSSGTETCNGGDDDCDGMVDEGDPDMLCPRGPHVATSTCSDVGACENTECEPGFGDCDDDTTTGCETQTNTAMHCGGCFVGCEPANATGDCSGGSCAVDVCDTGFGDCDGDPANGCETPLDSLTNCGGCGVGCSPAFSIGDCSTGTCEVGTCDPRRENCDGSPINGCETSTTTNADCGGCGTACAPLNAIGECSTGGCRIVSCTRADYDDCDMDPATGCETLLRTNADCAACGVMCTIAGGSTSCATGSCQLTGCAMGLADCDSAPGCEQPTNTLAHCGDCDTPCAPNNGTGSCATGTCAVTACNPGWDDCDGDPTNGCETPLNTLGNCGACGTSCALDHASESCATGACRITTCDIGWGQCDASHANGCEENLRTTSDCGACGVPCSRTNASASCSTGVCSFSSCNSYYSSCDGTTSNGCEVSHRAVSGACGGGTDAGTYDGDRSCGFICGGNTGWDNFAAYTARNSAWFRARVREDSTCSTDIEHRIRLSVPAGVDYDLYVYRSCGTLLASSVGGTGVDEEIIIRESESSGSDDDFDYFVEVRHYSGSTCSNYTIRFDGHNC